jgi:hypothetical protein
VPQHEFPLVLAAEPSSNNCLYCKVVTLRTSRARIRIHRVVNAKMYYSTQRQGETFSRSCPRTYEQRRATSQPSTNTAKPRVLDAGCTRSTSSPGRGGARRGRSQPAAPRWVCYVAITARPAGPSMSLALILPLVVRTSVPAGLSARHDDAVRLRRARPAASWWPYVRDNNNDVHAHRRRGISLAPRTSPPHGSPRAAVISCDAQRESTSTGQVVVGPSIRSKITGDPIGRSHGVAAEGRRSPCISPDLARHPVCARVPLGLRILVVGSAELRQSHGGRSHGWARPCRCARRM